ncbi:MAG: arginine--tRNA ligase [Thermodesulfobacteriota bacterium]
MKEKLRKMIHAAAGAAHKSGQLPSAAVPEVTVELPKSAAHGDYATNLAMQMAASQKMPPRKIAEILLAHLPDETGIIAKTEIAGPGFINFFIRPAAWHALLLEMLRADIQFGRANIGAGRNIQVEFVSANPTGPLHVGHGRGAAVGDSVANILSFCGYNVQREYYINDSGRQIRTLGLSVFLRCRELLGEKVDFPADCYQGAYIRELAAQVREEKGAELLRMETGAAVDYCARFAADSILKGIRTDLTDFGVTFDQWFSEQSLYDNGTVQAVLQDMESRGVVYGKDGAKWFRTTAYGDEKDRVVVRENGLTTYFASDIAYHQNKYERGFERVIDVWGADHHGYIKRVTAAVEASGRRKDQFHVILVHLVNLQRDGMPVAMSTRSGEFVTLQEVVQEVGRDAARFIFLTRHYESPLDFDLALAKKKTNENPVYYVQYVHARIASIIRKAREENHIQPVEWNPSALARLEAAEEIDLIKQLGYYPEVVRTAAELLEPHRITYYLMELAAAFHAYYNKHKVLTEDAELTNGRLSLVLAVQKMIRNGLTLLGVSAPEKM